MNRLRLLVPQLSTGLCTHRVHRTLPWPARGQQARLSELIFDVLFYMLCLWPGCDCWCPGGQLGSVRHRVHRTLPWPARGQQARLSQWICSHICRQPAWWVSLILKINFNTFIIQLMNELILFLNILFKRTVLKTYALYIFLVLWLMYFPPLYGKNSFKTIYSLLLSCVLVYVLSSFI